MKIVGSAAKQVETFRIDEGLGNIIRNSFVMVQGRARFRR
jgi:hypothetical protein